MNQQQTTQATDIKTLCAERLLELRKYVTPKDKQSCREIKNYSRQTIDDYLKGNVNKIDTAMDLIEFFSPIVSKRLTKIQNPLVAA